jgi:hypothetical protein
MNKQRGATFTVSQYLLILLIAAGVASGATSLWLSAHRTLEISCGS